MEGTFQVPQDPAIAILQQQVMALKEQVKVLMTQPDSPALTAAVAQWKRNMLTFGASAAAMLADPNISGAFKQDATYYDGTWVFLQIRDFTGDQSWQAAADNAHRYYRSYIDPNQGKIQAIWLFPHGLQAYGDLETVKRLALNGSFAPSYPLEWTASADSSREVAYNVMTKLVAVSLGQPVWGLEEQAGQMFMHIDQWTWLLQGIPVTAPAVPRPPTYCRPFMAAITSYALIEWAGTDTTRMAHVVATLTPFWELLWSQCFLAQQPVANNPGLGLVDTLMYTNIVAADGSGGQDPSPDLNLLIAPVLAWLYAQTKDIAWRDKHDLLFIGGVRGAYLADGKQFNQSYQWSFLGLNWRQA